MINKFRLGLCTGKDLCNKTTEVKKSSDKVSKKKGHKLIDVIIKAKGMTFVRGKIDYITADTIKELVYKG